VYLTPPAEGVPLELSIGTPDQKIPESWGYRAEKEVWRYLQPSGYNTPTWWTDGRTGGHVATAKTALTRCVARVKPAHDCRSSDVTLLWYNLCRSRELLISNRVPDPHLPSYSYYFIVAPMFFFCKRRYTNLRWWWWWCLLHYAIMIWWLWSTPMFTARKN